jgi:L-threonylcarbamoyladenylate synthase
MTADSDDIKKAATLLKNGKLVAFPTETVYGLGGNALDDDAIAAIYAAKQRPSFNPLIVHLRSLEDASHYVTFDERALKLARRFWPGPLTLVLPRAQDCKLSLLLSGGLDTVAVRIPSQPVAQALLHEAAIPVAAPSANRSGRVSATDAAHVREELGNSVAMILDDGPCRVGIESTVIDTTGAQAVILRPGAITRAQIEEVIGPVETATAADVVKAPGMMTSHYAPSKPLRLRAREVRDGEALLAFGAAPAHAIIVENLSVNGDLQEAAANLFRMLRKLDASDALAIAVANIPDEGLGIAINDRLMRAAAPR